MDAQVIGEVLRVFGDLEDPRRANRRYLLCDIILLAVAAVMCGCEGWQEIADWTAAMFEHLARCWSAAARHPYRPTPSAGCFARLSPEGFERLLCGLDSGPAAIDQGQFLRPGWQGPAGSFADGWKKDAPAHGQRYAWDHRLILGQLKVESKENEIVAASQVAGDAAPAATPSRSMPWVVRRQSPARSWKPKETMCAAAQRGPAALHGQVTTLLDEAIWRTSRGCGTITTKSTQGHGRETRKVWVCDDLQQVKAAASWPWARRRVARGGKPPGDPRPNQHRTPLLHRQPPRWMPSGRARRSAPAGYRESGALGSGRGVQRGPEPHPPGKRPRELRDCGGWSSINCGPIRSQRQSTTLRMKRKMYGWRLFFLTVLTA